MIRRLGGLVLTLLLIPFIAEAQLEKRAYSRLETGFIQFKESLNFGMVFNGPSVKYWRNWQHSDAIHKVSIETGGGLAIVTTKGIPGITASIQPLRADYLFIDNETGWKTGPIFTSDLDYQLYPDLQSGFSYWYTRYSLGFAIEKEFSLKGQQLLVTFNNSLFGLISRPPAERNPHYYDLGVGHALRYQHQDLKFKTIGDYNDGDLMIQWQIPGKNRIMIAYHLNYAIYSESPETKILSHNIQLIFKRKKDIAQ